MAGIVKGKPVADTLGIEQGNGSEGREMFPPN